MLAFLTFLEWSDLREIPMIHCIKVGFSFVNCRTRVEYISLLRLPGRVTSRTAVSVTTQLLLT